MVHDRIGLLNGRDRPSHFNQQMRIADAIAETVRKSHTSPPGHGYPTYKPLCNIIDQLRFRELGDRRYTQNKIWPSLISDSNREFCVTHEMIMNGRTQLDYKRVFSPTEVFEFDEMRMRPIAINTDPFVSNSQKYLEIDQTALILNGLEPRDGLKLAMEKYIVTLTSFGQVLFYVLKDDEYQCIHRFNLPANLYKLKSICWNAEKSEVFITGFSHRDRSIPRHSQSIEEGSSPQLRSGILVVISVYPEVKLKMQMKLEQSMFGILSAFSLHSDALICMRPGESSMYKMDEIYWKYCHHIPSTSDYGSVHSADVTRFNVDVKEKPVPFKEVKGMSMTLDIQISSAHAITYGNRRESRFQEPDLVKITRCDGVRPVMKDEWMNASWMEMGDGEYETRSCPDETARILRMERDLLICYSIRSASNEYDTYLATGETPPAEMEMEWSVKILPAERPWYESATGGRATGKSYLHNLKYVGGNMLMLTLIYDTDRFEDSGSVFSLCPILLLLDATTGQLVKCFPVENSVLDGDDGVQMGMDGLFSIGCTDTNLDKKKIKVHRLTDKSAELPIDFKMKSGVLSRKEERKRRQEEGRERNFILPGEFEIV